MKTRWFLTLLFFLGLVVGSLGADDLRPSELATKEALRSVIDSQLNAFRREDYAGAYGLADSEFRHQCPIDRFERLVKAGYPAIAHSTSARCGFSLDNGDLAVMNVRVFSEGHEPVDYQYSLRRDGARWRIVGVTLLKDQTTEV